MGKVWEGGREGEREGGEGGEGTKEYRGNTLMTKGLLCIVAMSIWVLFCKDEVCVWGGGESSLGEVSGVGYGDRRFRAGRSYSWPPVG